jgi:hypothetical protein
LYGLVQKTNVLAENCLGLARWLGDIRILYALSLEDIPDGKDFPKYILLCALVTRESWDYFHAECLVQDAVD